MRTCIGCRNRRPATELVRYTLDAAGVIRSGRTKPGRGAWVCPSRVCLEHAVQRSAFDRAFRVRVGPEAHQRLLDETSQLGCGS